MTTIPRTERMPAALPARRRRRWRNTPGFPVYAILGATVFGAIFPLYWSFLIASHDNSALLAGRTPLLPGGNFLTNAARVLDTVEFWRALGNSIIVSGTVTVSVVFFSALAGFAFAKLAFRGRKVLLAGVVVSMAVPTQLGVIPLFILMAELGWTGTLWAVIMPGLVTAFGVFWMTQYLGDALPDELIEAARLDGASLFRTFWHIALPALRPAAATLALFTFIATWTNFFWPLIALGPADPTLPIVLQQLQATRYVDYSLVLAGALMATVPLLLVFFFAGKQLVSGVMDGAVKG